MLGQDTLLILLACHLSLLVTGGSCCRARTSGQCSADQFKCKNENKNQILSINDFNKEREKCIPLYYRCDGRHDCQDGSDENDCNFSRITVNKRFLCYEGFEENLIEKDCIKSDLETPAESPSDYLSLTLSVSESSEWVCTKTVNTNGSIVRGCEKTYTDTPMRCLCSRQLCNSSERHSASFSISHYLLISTFYPVVWLICK